MTLPNSGAQLQGLRNAVALGAWEKSHPSEQQQGHLLDVGAFSTCSKMQFTSLQPSLPNREVYAWLWKTPNHTGQCSAKAFPSKESLL